MIDRSVLQCIVGNVQPLLTERFRRAENVPLESAPPTRKADLNREVKLAPLEAVIDEAMRKFLDRPTKSDAWLGPRVHATLRLTRREATDKGIWAWLHVLAFPNYVRWRWPPIDDVTPIPFNRFIGDDSNSGLERLWWATEISRNGPDYALSVRALSTRRFDIWQRAHLMHNKACALAVVDFLSSVGGRGVNNEQTIAMVKALNVAVRTRSIDALAPSSPTDADAVRAWVREPVDETTMMNDLPVGPDEAQISPASIDSARKFIEKIASQIRLDDMSSRRVLVTR